MNKSFEYIVKRCGDKKNPTWMKMIDWAHGRIEPIAEFIQKAYEDKGLDTIEESKLPREEGKIFLFEKEIPGSKNGVDYKLPVKVLYDPEARFNTYAITERAGLKKDIDVSEMLVYKIIGLQIPMTTAMTKITDFKNIEVVLYVGDIVWSSEREVKERGKAELVKKIYCAAPICCKIRPRKKEEKK